MRYEEVLHKVKKERNVLHKRKVTKAHWICNMLCRNCLPKHVIEKEIEGIIEVTGRRGRRGEEVLDDLKETKDL
jgi:hypothetical protein